MRTYEGNFDARDLRVAVVVSRFNETISKQLLEGALDSLRRHGANDDNLSVTWVPGAYELPLAAERIAGSGTVDAVVCLGAVIRGETAHFEYVAGGAANGIAEVSLRTGVPVAFGVLTTETTEQAANRAGGKMGNKGAEAATVAIEMANLLAALPKPDEKI
ncbi:MAG: 6,7-dimethyl-8-ribityllumazine synthase [Actinobacteria bacterium]|nr:6,7-dimethyl-8-ribityllumazine synthase [Actinomycetota bacterium]